ncbi:uncharacterized protein LOC144446769 [Glandiceps talaboti]
MLRESLLVVILTVVLPRLQTALAVALDDNNDIDNPPILQISKYWPTDELGSSPLLGENVKEDEKRNGFWNGKRNGFWNGKRNGFWNGKRNIDETKRNGFWNGKRSGGSMAMDEEKRNGFWNGKRTTKATGNNFLNMLSSKKPETEQQCSPCGPGGKGQCVTYGVCCGVETGCYILTTEADVCVTNPPTTLCGGSNRDCGKDGKCVADGICCNASDRSCSINPDCDIVWY